MTATRKARIRFDLAILDEAHKTVGMPSKAFATLLSEKNIKIQRRVFMTATERVFRGDRNDVLSMDNEKDYGARFFQLSFKDAIRQGITDSQPKMPWMIAHKELRLKNWSYRQILVTAGAGQAAAVEVHLVPEQRQPNPTDHEQRSCRSGECYKGNGSFDYIRAHILALLPTPLPESLPRQTYDRTVLGTIALRAIVPTGT